MNPTIYVLPLIVVGALTVKSLARPTIIIPPEVRNDLVFVLSTCPSQIDTVFVLTNDAVFHKLDRTFWGDVLLQAKDIQTYRAAVIDYRKKFLSGKRNPQNPLGTAQEIDEAVAYGDTTFSTPIWASPRDARWDAMLDQKTGYGYGKPEHEWQTQGAFASASEGVLGKGTLYIMSWANGREAVLQSDTVGGVPTRIIPERVLKTPVALPIRPYVETSMFPNLDGSYTFTTSVLVTGNNFTIQTLDVGSVFMELTVSRGDSVFMRDTLVGGLSALRALLLRAEDISGQAIVTHLGSRTIPAGESEAKLLIKGRGQNSGTFFKRVIAPSPYASQGMSDLVLLQDEVLTGDGIQRGIQRYGRTLYIDPLKILIRGNARYSTLRPYVEFLPPNTIEQVGAYRVYILREPKTGEAIGYPASYFEDEDGHPLSSSTTPRRHVEGTSSERGMLVHSQVVSLTDSVTIFDTPIDVFDAIRQMKPGNYFVRVEFEGRLSKASRGVPSEVIFTSEVPIRIAQ